MEPPRPWPIEGATGTEFFRAYVQEVLMPALRAGDLVVMDNLAPHKNEQTIALVRQAGADVAFLTPYPAPDQGSTAQGLNSGTH